MEPFTHVDGDGRVRMVDVSTKDPTTRTALASCVVRTDRDVFSLDVGTDDLGVVAAARLAGIQAAKRTSHLIPLCHPLNLSVVEVDVGPDPLGAAVRARVVTVNRTGVEMEALVACAFAALSLTAALRAAGADARFDDLAVLAKSGGKSGDWGRDITPAT